jgi:hypothetical protein
MNNNDDLFNRWNAWLEVIYDDVQGLLINRQIYQEVQKTVQSNRKIQIESAYYEWTAIIYASTQSIGVRRQIDPRPDVISFANLLGEIEEKPEILSRQRYIALNRKSILPEESVEESFDQLAGKGKPHIDPEMVRVDLTEIKDKTDKIRKYANQRITHLDRSDFKGMPTLVEMDECLELLETLLKKYLRLFRANAPASLVPAWQYDWKKIFKTPWIE